MSGDASTKHSSKKNRRIIYQLPADEPAGVAFQALTCTKLAAGVSPPGSTVQFIDNGAQKLNGIHLQLIFWGTQWGPTEDHFFDADGNEQIATTPNALADQVTNAVQNLLAGPYMSYLVAYGVHRASMRGTTFVLSDPPNPFAQGDVGNFVINQLDNEILPEPDSDWPIVYAVIMPSNVSYQGQSPPDTLPLPPGVVSGVLGANSRVIWYDYDIGDVDNDPAHYFWVGSSGADATQANLDYITTVLSHELIETCTDPNGGDGLVQVGGTKPTAQTGDACTSWCDYVRNVKAQSYWVHNLGDPRNGQCVLPQFYSVRRTLADRNIGGRLGSIQFPIPSLNSLITSLF
jgi:hypothetical protein